MRYKNPHAKRLCRGFIHFVLWMCGYYKDRKKKVPIPEGFYYPNFEEEVAHNQDFVTWINHATFLVGQSGITFLCDPIWNERCSPLSSFGPKRLHPPPMALEELPRIDYVILSHDHYDHLDLETLKKLAELFPRLRMIVPSGLKKWLSCHIPKIRKGSIIELEWWQSYREGKVTFTAVPSQHFAGRGLFDRNRRLWMGCHISSGKKRFYFVGDTGYNEYDFKEIGGRLGPVDLALIPIGTYLPRRFMQAVHVNPAEAVLIHKEVGAKKSVGGHFGTFRLSEEEVERPPYDLYLALQQEGIPCSQFRVLRPGQSIPW